MYTNTIFNQHYEVDPLPYYFMFNPTVAIRGHELKLLVEFYAWNSLPRSISPSTGAAFMPRYYWKITGYKYGQRLCMVSSKYAKCSVMGLYMLYISYTCMSLSLSTIITNSSIHTWSMYN